MAKNDNLVKYRQRLQEQNKNLILRAIEHIVSLNGEISFSMVSKVTYEIADALKGEKGLTLAGISKNPLYRTLIEKAKAQQNIKSNQINYSTKKNISAGDMQITLHSLRIENIELKRKIKILETKLKNINPAVEIMPNIDDKLFKEYEKLHSVCFSLVNRLLELELVYIDLKDKTLNVSVYNEVVMQKESLELILKDKIDEIRNKI